MQQAPIGPHGSGNASVEPQIGINLRSDDRFWGKQIQEPRSGDRCLHPICPRSAIGAFSQLHVVLFTAFYADLWPRRTVFTLPCGLPASPDRPHLFGSCSSRSWLAGAFDGIFGSNIRASFLPWNFRDDTQSTSLPAKKPVSDASNRFNEFRRRIELPAQRSHMNVDRSFKRVGVFPT